MQFIKVYYVCKPCGLPCGDGNRSTYFETVYICTDASKAHALKISLGYDAVVREKTLQNFPGIFDEYA